MCSIQSNNHTDVYQTHLNQYIPLSTWLYKCQKIPKKIFKMLHHLKQHSAMDFIWDREQMSILTTQKEGEFFFLVFNFITNKISP